MIVKIDKLSHDFRGLCKINNKVTFVTKSLPNEIIDLTLTNQKKNYNEGKINNIINPSNIRVEPLCQYANICGGCNIAHINYTSQLETKQNNVINIMKKYAGILVKPAIISNNNIYHYRNKISLKIKEDKLALVETSTNNLVKIDSCLLANENINKVIKILNNIDLSRVDNLIIRGENELMVIVNGTINKDILIQVLSNYVSSIILNNKTIYGNDYIKIKVKNLTYAIYPNSFFQVNTKMIEKLYDKVKEYAGCGEELLDLYCGAGTIALYLADNFKTVRGIEINKDAIISANLNKKLNSIDNISFECQNASNITNIEETTIVVDPPRSGLDKKTISKILNSHSSKIVYVSCNPITLARDINILKDKYNLEEMTLFDMFPNTYHVECVCVLKLK